MEVCTIDIEQEILQTKSRAKSGCLLTFIIFIALIFGLIIYIIGSFFYELDFKETMLATSHSPNHKQVIQVLEAGSPVTFGPSAIRLKYKDKKLETSISNDGKKLDQSNVSIKWKDDTNAVISLHGEEQAPEVIRFQIADGKASFEVQHVELGYIPAYAYQDPSLEYALQIRKSAYSKGSETSYNYDVPVRVYYGKKGKEPDQFKEWNIPDFSSKDTFKLYWNEDYVMIDVLGKNDNGTTFVKGSLKLILNEVYGNSH